jgi:putative aldouronate transport system permease protein
MRKKRSIINKRYLPLLLMVIPGLVYLIINNYIPMFGLVIAFKQYNVQQGIFGSAWVGFQNFKFLFSTGDAFIITRNTLGYNFVFIVAGTIVSIAIAIMLNELRARSASQAYQSVILMPYLISMVIVSYLVNAFLSVDTGMINRILTSIGLKEISWYTEPKYWPFILVIVSLWKNSGYTCVIYLASVVGINKEYYEAAMLDGASRWQQIIKITIPLIRPTIIIMVVLAIGRIFRSDFGLFYQVPLNSGMLFKTTNVIDTYVYRGLMEIGDIGMSAAAGLYQSVVGFALLILSNLYIRRIDPDSALF